MNQAIRQAAAHYRRIVSLVLVAWITIGPAQYIWASSPRSESQPVIIVEIQNYTHVNRLEIQEAERQAAAILANAGVRVFWLDFLPKKHVLQPSPDNLPADFSVRILYSFTRIRVPQVSGADALGECTIPSGTEVPVRGGITNVFDDRVVEVSTRWGLFPAEVLGDAIAHELGHLLLGTGHSSQGVMKGSWTSLDLQLASRGKLRFSADQAGLLHRAAQSLRQNPSPTVIAER